MGVRRFTRLTNAFSKRFENHCYMVAIYHPYYNFCRMHQTLRATPAMEARLTDHVWCLGRNWWDYWSRKRSSSVNDGLILPILLGFFSLVGVWMFISPEQYVLWIKMLVLLWG